MTRTNFNLFTSELKAGVENAMFKPTLFFIVPPWLDETLQAHSLNETILSNADTVNSILTADDIKFYNQQAGRFTCLTERFQIPNDVTLSYLQSKTNFCSSSIEAPESLSYEENSISRKEKIIPFIKDGHKLDDRCIWNIVASYSIHRLAETNVVGIRLVMIDEVDIPSKQMEENEKLAEFAIEELGLTVVAGSHLFKKLLEFKRSYY